MKFYPMILLLALTFLLSSCGTYPQQLPAITGTVNYTNGSPGAGVTVNCAVTINCDAGTENYSAVTTDANGNYELKACNEQVYYSYTEAGAGEAKFSFTFSLKGSSLVMDSVSSIDFRSSSGLPVNGTTPVFQPFVFNATVNQY